jgi:histidinol phosphatase-like enzyme
MKENGTINEEKKNTVNQDLKLLIAAIDAGVKQGVFTRIDVINLHNAMVRLEQFITEKV